MEYSPSILLSLTTDLIEYNMKASVITKSTACATQLYHPAMAMKMTPACEATTPNPDQYKLATAPPSPPV